MQFLVKSLTVVALMKEYEITYISSPQLTEEARVGVDATVDGFIDKLSGTITHADANTRRRLFYPIKKQPTGFARTLNILLDPAHLIEVRQMLHKHADILRTTILQTPRREEVTMAIFDEIDKPAAPVAKAAEKKPAKPVTMAEVEERIEEALDEEVK